MDQEQAAAVRRVAIVIEPGGDLLDIAGPAAVFHCAARHFAMVKATDGVSYALDYLSLDGGPIRTRQELSIETASLQDADPAGYDTVIVVGTASALTGTHERLLDWLKSCDGVVRRIASVCVGAFTLARAGLLDGRRATTHWEDCSEFEAQFPAVLVEADAIYTEDSGVWTGAGVSAGIDLALAMIEQDHGHEIALLVARRQVVFLKRPGGQSQFSVQLQQQKQDHALRPLLQWIVDNPTADLRAEALAQRANMSLRSFYRIFILATGLTPADWVEMARLEVAKRLLEHTGHKLEKVASNSGFGTYERMRRAFGRRLAIAPSDYRRRFSLPRGDGGGAIDLWALSDAYGIAPGQASVQ